MGRTNDNVSLAKKKQKIYIGSTKKVKVKYHKIYFGKPSADYYIDDKNLNFNPKWVKELKKIL